MTTSQQITKFLVDAIAYHEDRAKRFRKTLEAFQETGTASGGMVINVAQPPVKRAPRGSHLETIKAHLSGGVAQCIGAIANALSIPRSSVSTVLHKHRKTFVFEKGSGRWSMRHFTLAPK